MLASLTGCSLTRRISVCMFSEFFNKDLLHHERHEVNTLIIRDFLRVLCVLRGERMVFDTSF